MTHARGTTDHGNSFFTDILRDDSRDASGRLYRIGHIESCRDWQSHGDSHALRHYAAYLADEWKEASCYEELCSIISGEFLVQKTTKMSSLLPAIQDVRQLTTAARSRGDLEQYGLSLGLSSRLSQRVVGEAEAGSVVLLAMQRRVPEAVSLAIHGRSTRQAFDLLTLTLRVLDADDQEAVSQVGDALLECVSQMDNEGTRAHHLHRVLHAMRPKHEVHARALISKCVEMASCISDQFQRNAARVLLVQQIAPLDLDRAERLARDIAEDGGMYFADLAGDAFQIVATIGRGAELPDHRHARLARLLEYATALTDHKLRWRVSSALLLERCWEQPSPEALWDLAHLLRFHLEESEDDDIGECISVPLAPEPVRVNNANAPYECDESAEGSDAGIETVPARCLGEALQLLRGLQDAAAALSHIVDTVIDRVLKVGDEEKRAQLLRDLVFQFVTLAADLGGDSGVQTLEYLERLLERKVSAVDASLSRADIAAGWYHLRDPHHGCALLRQCVQFVRQRLDDARTAEKNDAAATGSGRLLSSRVFQTFLGLRRGTIRESDSERTRGEAASVTRRLAESLSRIPAEYRVDAFREIEPALSSGSADSTSGGVDGGIVACALADVDLDLAAELVERPRKGDGRWDVAAALGKHVGKRDIEAGLRIIDSCLLRNAGERAVDRICALCARLHTFDVPRVFWAQIADVLAILPECNKRTLTAQICALRLADTSLEAALSVATTEVQSCRSQEDPQLGQLKVLQRTLRLLRGDLIDVPALLQDYRRTAPWGDRSKQLIRRRVAPVLAVSEPRSAVELLEAVGELQEDLVAMAVVVLTLLGRGDDQAALGIVRCFREVLARLPVKNQEYALADFLGRLATHEGVSDTARVSSIWRWLLDQRAELEEASWVEQIGWFHVVYLAAKEPGEAVRRWFDACSEQWNVALPLFERAMTADPTATLEAIKTLPDGEPKASALAEAYACLAASNGAQKDILIPSPFRLLHCLPEDADRGRLLANYIAVVPESDAAQALAAIGRLPDLEERLRPVETAVKRFGATHREIILDVLQRSIGTYIRARAKSDSSDYELCEWVCAAAALSLDAGIDVVLQIRDSLGKRKAAKEILAVASEVTPELVSRLLPGLDEMDGLDVIEEAAKYIAVRDLPRTGEFLEAFEFLDEIDRERCMESAREACLNEAIKRDPDVALENLSSIPEHDAQASRLKEILSVLEEVDSKGITRWRDLSSIVRAWADGSQSPVDACDYRTIKEISHFAPEVAHDRLKAKPPSKERAEACMRLLPRLSSSEHLRVLQPAISGYREYINAIGDEPAELQVITGNTFFEQLEERIIAWNDDIVDRATPLLTDALRDLAVSGKWRERLIVALLNRVSVSHTEVITKLYEMLDAPEQRSKAGMVLARRTPPTQLPALLRALRGAGSPRRTTPGQAAAVLGGLTEVALKTPLMGAKGAWRSEELDSIDPEVLQLVIGSCRLLLSFRDAVAQDTRVTMCRLVHQSLARVGHEESIATLLLGPARFEGGLDAEDAGKAVAALLTGLAHVSEEGSAREFEAIVRLVIDGDPEGRLSPLIGAQQAPLQGSGARRFVEQVLLNTSSSPQNLCLLAKECTRALSRSYSSNDDCFAELLVVLGALRQARPEVRREFGDQLIDWVEATSRTDEAFRQCLPALRICAASELFLPEYVSDCLVWFRRGLREFSDYALDDGLFVEYLQSATRIGYAFGRISLTHARGPLLVPGAQSYLSYVLILLAELEYVVRNPSAGRNVEGKVRRSCGALLKHIGALERVCGAKNSPRALWGLRLRRKRITQRLLRGLRRVASAQQHSVMPRLARQPEEAENKGPFAYKALLEFALQRLKVREDLLRQGPHGPPKMHERRRSIAGRMVRALRGRRLARDRSKVESVTRHQEEVDASEEEFDGAMYLHAFAGMLWKVGFDSVGLARDEIVRLMRRLAQDADLGKMSNASSLSEIDERFELELFVRSLGRLDREAALEFVETLAQRNDGLGDLGLFDELVVDDPKWVIANACRLGARDSVGKRIASLLKRLAAEAPDQLPDVAEILQAELSRREDWFFRAEVSEALGTAAPDMVRPEGESILPKVPEFWARATVTSETIKRVWQHDPMEALHRMGNIELEEVRLDTLVRCIRAIASSDRGEPFVRTLKASLLQCRSLRDVEGRFKAAREVMLVLANTRDAVTGSLALDLVYTFLELFASAPTDWLRLAFVHAAPTVFEVAGGPGLSMLAKSMFADRVLIDEHEGVVRAHDRVAG